MQLYQMKVGYQKIPDQMKLTQLFATNLSNNSVEPAILTYSISVVLLFFRSTVQHLVSICMKRKYITDEANYIQRPRQLVYSYHKYFNWSGFRYETVLPCPPTYSFIKYQSKLKICVLQVPLSMFRFNSSYNYGILTLK